MSGSLVARLSAGLEQMGLEIAPSQQERMLTYLAELAKWNRAYNLSAVRDPEAMIGRHLLDSLSVLPPLSEHAPHRMIDVGTGAGLPGIPLALARLDWHWTLLDSNGKKTRFLIHVKTRLGLDNVTVENRRVGDYRPERPFDGVISRAFASLADMDAGCRHLLVEGGRYFAMKGQYPERELDRAAERLERLVCHRLQVPGSEAERHLLVLRPR